MNGVFFLMPYFKVENNMLSQAGEWLQIQSAHTLTLESFLQSPPSSNKIYTLKENSRYNSILAIT